MSTKFLDTLPLLILCCKCFLIRLDFRGIWVKYYQCLSYSLIGDLRNSFLFQLYHLLLGLICSSLGWIRPPARPPVAPIQQQRMAGWHNEVNIFIGGRGACCRLMGERTAHLSKCQGWLPRLLCFSIPLALYGRTGMPSMEGRNQQQQQWQRNHNIFPSFCHESLLFTTLHKM